MERARPVWVGKAGRQVREGFLEEVISKLVRGKSELFGRKGERALQASRNSKCRGKHP